PSHRFCGLRLPVSPDDTAEYFLTLGATPHGMMSSQRGSYEVKQLYIDTVSCRSRLLVPVILCMVTAPALRAQTFTTLYTFPAGTVGEIVSNMALAQGIDGNFYGTTEGGGAYNWGSVF